MKKLIVVGASILVVGLLILGSQTNVVGYRTVQQSPINIAFLPGVSADRIRAVSGTRGEIPLPNPPYLPDIIISDVDGHLYKHGDMQYWVFGFFCKVTNLGATAPNLYIVDVQIAAEVYNFSTKTFDTYDTFHGSFGSSLGFKSGWTDSLWFADEYNGDESPYIHPRGIIRFRCHANIDREEINTSNNNRTIIFFHPAYFVWIPIYKSFEHNILTYLRSIFLKRLGIW
jgi:hypothetical protein